MRRFREARKRVSDEWREPVKHRRGAAFLAVLALSCGVPIAPAAKAAEPPSAASSTPGVCAGRAGITLDIVSLHNPAGALPPLADPLNFTTTQMAAMTDQIRAALTPISPCFAIFSPPRSSDLFVLGTSEDHAIVRRIVASVETGGRLVVLETRVYEVDATTAENLGIQYQNPVLTAQIFESTPAAVAAGTAVRTGTLLRDPLALTAALNALVDRGEARVLADPNVTAISGRPVQIHAGSDLNVLAFVPTSATSATAIVPTLQTFTLGVTVEMVPMVNSTGDSVALTVKAQESHLVSLTNGAPQISRRDEETSVFLHDDQMVLLGGLRLDTSNRDVQKIAVLGDIPIIGGLFRYKTTATTHSELVILVRAHILDMDHVVPCDATHLITDQPRDCAGEVNKVLPPKKNPFSH